MQTATKSRVRRALWIILPVLAVSTVVLPRALAWGRQRASSPAELAEQLESGLDHVLDKVDATATQRAQANAIAARRAPALFAVITRGRQVRGQLKQVMLADRLDRARLTEAQAQVGALSAEATQIGLDALFELSEVLTPAQRKQLADRLSQLER